MQRIRATNELQRKGFEYILHIESQDFRHITQAIYPGEESRASSINAFFEAGTTVVLNINPDPLVKA